MEDVRLTHGDSLAVLPTLETASVDSIVTDPPAGISFMNLAFDTFPSGGRGICRKTGNGNPCTAHGFAKDVHWEHTPKAREGFITFLSSVMRECFRVLKPGCYGLVWAIPRTSHWTATALEDAGFEIRDRIAHLFGQGFPKGKTCLKPACEDWWLVRKPGGGKMKPLGIDECRIKYQGDADKASATPQGRCTSKSGALAGGGEYDIERVEFERPKQTGRYPANLVLSHVAPDENGEGGCVCVGTKRVKGVQRAAGSPGFGAEREDGYQIGTGRQYAPDGEVEEWRCVDFSGYVPVYEYSGRVFAHEETASSLLDLLPSLLQDLREYSTNDKVPSPDAFAFYRNADKRSQASSSASLTHAVCYALTCSGVPGFQVDCPSCRGFCDARLHRLLDAAQSGPASLADALECVYSELRSLGHNQPSQSRDHLSSCDGAAQPCTCDNKQQNKKCAAHRQPSSHEQDRRIEDKLQREPQPCEHRDNSEGNRSFGSDNPETSVCSACISGIQRTLCMLSADLAWRFFLPGRIIHKREVFVSVKCPVAELDRQSGSNRGSHGDGVNRQSRTRLSGFGMTAGECKNDCIGGASRFFFCAKASRRDRGEGNSHPTVKSTALMSWLVKLVTPPGGLCLDPFAGSGSTLLACLQTGRRGLGIEIDPQYHAIAEKRIAESRAAHSLFDGVV